MPDRTDGPRVAISPNYHLPLRLQTEMPLRGVTVLVVEDSRHAAEGLRLSFQRLGARMRRAETLEDARSHLRTYRPDILLVDLGLPDGSGASLIRQMTCSANRPPLILGLSADPMGRPIALAAGAQGFLEKPLPAGRGLASLLAPWFPDLRDWQQSDNTAPMDPLALRDDLRRAVAVLLEKPDPTTRDYLFGHLAGLARCTGDQALADTVARARGQDEPIEGLIGSLQDRIGPVQWH